MVVLRSKGVEGNGYADPTSNVQSRNSRDRFAKLEMEF